MNKTQFMDLYDQVISFGYQDEIDWAENLKPCEDALVFLLEYIWVVVNSGMKNQIAEKIFNRIMKALREKTPISEAFKHPGKLKAIAYMCCYHEETFSQYQSAENKLEFLESLSWIGKITKYHLAKNLGIDIAKPDRHLVRIAAKYKTTPQGLCEKLSKDTGFRIATIDQVLWRSANLGLI